MRSQHLSEVIPELKATTRVCATLISQLYSTCGMKRELMKKGYAEQKWKIKELMVDHKKRAERRRAYYDSKLGDPHQLLRVTGSATKLYPDAEQFYYQENTNNLMPWQGDPDVRIDRFDGRALLDYIPISNPRIQSQLSQEDQELADDLNFARYHDLVEAERLHVTEKERLEEVEEEWTKLLDRHKALLAMLNSKKSEKSAGYAYDYGNTIHDDLDKDKESELLRDILLFFSLQTDILQYVDDLTDKDRQILNDMAKKYSIRNYSRLLRLAKKDRDDQLRELRAQQKGYETKPKENNRRAKDDKRRRRRSKYDSDNNSARSGRKSPSYEPYRNDSDSESSGDEADVQSEFVIEFGETPSADVNQTDTRHFEQTNKPQKQDSTQDKRYDDLKPELTAGSKPLTPMEKLKLRMRAGLERQIRSDEHDKLRKEREREMDLLQTYAKSQTIPVTPLYMRPPLPRRQNNDDRTTADEDAASVKRSSPQPPVSNRQYRSPSSSRSRSPIREPSDNSEGVAGDTVPLNRHHRGLQMQKNFQARLQRNEANATVRPMSLGLGQQKETDTDVRKRGR
ncbi:hypothetical protein EC973_003432 [Apophysomyces ossiformis]|uniref:Suppressor of white apricot N-terminal domain-containing protein n=1 Tax=Apophysomyces ossiformis TaxID=679940 RepID=A0A8H7EME3_9FUNG|nr:hypothetical protein EC973_003432 [Apophysomyces ossiformis]